MPSAWSWYQIVDARWSFGYWKVAYPGPQSAPNPRVRLALEEVVPGALRRVAGRDVARVRQIPRLGVAVALVADPDCAVDVGDDRHRTGVRAGRGRKGRARVTAVRAPGWVGPVQCWIHRQQVRQVVTIRVDQLVDPLDPDWAFPIRLDGERRRVVEQQTALACRADGTVAPDRRSQADRRAGPAARSGASRSRSSRWACRARSGWIPPAASPAE